MSDQETIPVQEEPKKTRKRRVVKTTAGGNDRPNMGVDDITQQIRDGITSVLQKSVKKIEKDAAIEGKYPKSKASFNAIALGSRTSASGNTEDKAWRRLSDQELRDLSLIDPYVGAIVSTRCSQAASIGRPSKSKFDKGFRVSEIEPLNREDFEDDEAYEREVKVKDAEMAAIMKWVMNCGTADKRVLDYAYWGCDPTFKKCSFKNYIESQTRNLLVFGRMADQIFRNADGVPVFWRPVPVETIRPAVRNQAIHINQNEDTFGSSLKDVEEYNKLTEEERPTSWIQQINGQDVNFFTDDDMKVHSYQMQALFDLRGYPLAPLEQALYLVFTHQQTLTYLRNQFVKGLCAKGILTIRSIDPQVELSSADVEEFKQQFENFVARNDNSATCPVLADAQVEFTPLNQTPRDMEFLQLEEHIIRALCSAFQISPMEMGYGNLSIGQGGITQGNKQEDIIKGEERGLRNLLDVIFESVNELLYENFPEAEGKYVVTYVGVGEDTRDSVVQRGLTELQTTATLGSLYADSEKTDSVKIGADVPLSNAYHQNVLRYMKYGVIMEKLFGEEGASEKPEYDFIVDPNLNQAYQQNKMMAAQAQGQGMPGQQAGMPPQGQPGQGQSPQEQQGQPMQESEGMTLQQRYEQLHKSERSAVSLFSGWISANKD